MRLSPSVAVLCGGLLFAPTLACNDLWSRPFPGVRVLRRSGVNPQGLPVELFAAVVDLCDPHVSLGATAPADGGISVPAWANRVHAAIAVNADYFHLTTRTPVGPARGGGVWWPPSPREHHDSLLLMGSAGAVSLLDAADFTVPALWSDAERTVSPQWTDVIAGREHILLAGASRMSAVVHGSPERHPRTAVGLSADRHRMILLVVDGRSVQSVGANANELSATLRALGASDGLKLDGGGSSTFFVQGEGVINHPSDGSPRSVANHLGVFIHEPPAREPSRRCPVTPGGAS